MSILSALVPCQPGEKIVNYPTRPVDSTIDFEGTTNLQPSQQVCNNIFLIANKGSWTGKIILFQCWDFDMQVLCIFREVKYMPRTASLFIFLVPTTEMA